MFHTDCEGTVAGIAEKNTLRQVMYFVQERRLAEYPLFLRLYMFYIFQEAILCFSYFVKYNTFSKLTINITGTF